MFIGFPFCLEWQPLGAAGFGFRAASAGRRCRLSRSRNKAAQLQAVRKRIARQIETP